MEDGQLSAFIPFKNDVMPCLLIFIFNAVVNMRVKFIAMHSSCLITFPKTQFHELPPGGALMPSAKWCDNPQQPVVINVSSFPMRQRQ